MLVYRPVPLDKFYMALDVEGVRMSWAMDMALWMPRDFEPFALS